MQDLIVRNPALIRMADFQYPTNEFGLEGIESTQFALIQPNTIESILQYGDDDQMKVHELASNR